MKPVRACICHRVTFAELREAKVASLEDIAERFGCGTGCGLCRPYLQRLLATGETEFDVLSEEDSHPS